MEQRVDLDQPIPVEVTKLIVGLFFTALGLLLAADNLRLLRADDYLQYWPAVAVLIGLIKLADPGRRLVGTTLIVIGASLLAYTAGWVHFTIFNLWPLLLIGIGAAMVARAAGVRVPGTGAQTGRNILAALTTRKINETSRDYSGNGIVAAMGACQLDLSQADIAHGPAIIEAFAFWGGIEIFIPENWEVIGEVFPFMGGFDVRTSVGAKPDRQLIVRGAAIMGGIEVKRRSR